MALNKGVIMVKSENRGWSLAKSYIGKGEGGLSVVRSETWEDH